MNVKALIEEAERNDRMYRTHQQGGNDALNDLVNRLAAALSALSGETEVTTAEELEALPFGSVVVDFAGTARTKRRADSHMGYGWTAGGRHPISSANLADGRTMTVLHNPEVTK